MDIFHGLLNEHSDKVSNKYLSVNNFGFHKNIEKNLKTLRKNGRSDYQIIYIDKGTGNFIIDGKSKSFSAGTVILYRPFERQEYVFDAGSTYYWIHFSGTIVENLLKELKIENTFFSTGESFSFIEIFEKMRKDSTIIDEATTELLSSNTIYFLSLVSRKIHTTNNIIYTVIEKMHTDFQNRLTNSDYAKICGVSEYHFIKKFKKETGLTPLQYKTKILVSKAIELLETTNLNISEISRTLGFADSLYFSRVFKKETGVSPKKYINSKSKDI